MFSSHQRDRYLSQSASGRPSIYCVEYAFGHALIAECSRRRGAALTDNCRASDARGRSPSTTVRRRSGPSGPERDTPRTHHHLEEVGFTSPEMVTIERSGPTVCPLAAVHARFRYSMEVCTCRRGFFSPWPAWLLWCCPAAPVLPGCAELVLVSQSGLPRPSLARAEHDRGRGGTA
jgi:hypothetical protein